MGCDIHTYIEFADFTKADGKPYWSNFTRNGGSRNYLMFGVVAGVRMEEAKLFDPKGMPDDGLGFWTDEDFWTRVAPSSNPEWANGDGWASKDAAEGWIASGYSIAHPNDNGELRRVSGPDWHSHSWLTADELEQALNHYSEKFGEFYPGESNQAPAEWKAMLAAMRSFEYDGKQTRLVFWFDN